MGRAARSSARSVSATEAAVFSATARTSGSANSKDLRSPSLRAAHSSANGFLGSSFACSISAMGRAHLESCSAYSRQCSLARPAMLRRTAYLLPSTSTFYLLPPPRTTRVQLCVPHSRAFCLLLPSTFCGCFHGSSSLPTANWIDNLSAPPIQSHLHSRSAIPL